jgi:hypothetical protein
MLNLLGTNPTQVLGLLAFAISAFSCWRTGKTQGSPWNGIAIAQCGCFAEVLIGLRLRLHDIVDWLLQAEGWYAARQALQLPLLATAMVLALGGFLLMTMRWLRRDPIVWAAMLATSAVLGLFVVESISLHRVDALMYAPVGPLLGIAIPWTLGAAIVTAAAWRARQRPDSKK